MGARVEPAGPRSVRPRAGPGGPGGHLTSRPSTSSTSSWPTAPCTSSGRWPSRMNYRLSPAEAGDILEHAEVSAVVAGGSLRGRRRRRHRTGCPPSRLVATVGGRGSTGDRRHRGRHELPTTRPSRQPLDGRGPGRHHVHLGDHRPAQGRRRPPRATSPSSPTTRPDWSGTGWLTATPVFTLAGLGFIYNPMKAGMTVLYLPNFDAGRWLEIVEQERPVIAFVVPAMAQLLIHHPAVRRRPT